MAKVLGIGGVFFKARDPEALASWYATCLGLNVDSSFGGTVFASQDLPDKAYTVWSPFADTSTYFAPSPQRYMINFIVDDLAAALDQVVAGGATLAGDPEESEFGKFGWFVDPEGNKVELWEIP